MYITLYSDKACAITILFIMNYYLTFYISIFFDLASSNGFILLYTKAFYCNVTSGTVFSRPKNLSSSIHTIIPYAISLETEITFTSYQR